VSAILNDSTGEGCAAKTRSFILGTRKPEDMADEERQVHVGTYWSVMLRNGTIIVNPMVIAVLRHEMQGKGRMRKL
jgi:hypothetical protein